MNIIEKDFRGIDLNLLVTFMVLLRERSVSRAAECLYLGQPAVSGALNRLRELFDDVLLVRTAQGMEPTSKALALEAALAPTIAQLQATLFMQPVFDPASDERLFTIGMPDWIDIWLTPLLFARLQKVAPKVRVAVKACAPQQGAEMLEKKEVDIGIAAFSEGPGWLRRHPLKQMGFCCVYSPGQLTVADPISLSQYLHYPHLLVSYRAAFQGVVDKALAENGLNRHVALSTPHFAALPAVLRQSPAIATVPSVLGEIWQNCFGLKFCQPPIPLPAFTVSMIWHATRDKDPALQWLLTVIQSLIAPPNDTPGNTDITPTLSTPNSELSVAMESLSPEDLRPSPT